MQDGQACNLHPLSAYASVDDAKKVCMPELFLKGCSPVLITTEGISIACVPTVTAHLHAYHSCTYQRELCTGALRLTLTCDTALLREWLVFTGKYVQDCYGECVETDVRPIRRDWLRRAAHVSSRELSHD